MNNAEDVLEGLQSGAKTQVIATCCLSNHGGVAIYYADSECVVAQYYDNAPEIYEIEYVEEASTEGEENNYEPIFKIGEIEIHLNECIVTNF